MESTHGKVLAAYRTITQFAQKDMKSLCAYKLFRLRKALMEDVEFQTEQEKKKIADLGGTVTETGEIKLTKEKMAEYIKWHGEFDADPCEVDREKTVLFLRELPEISIADMETLDEFVDWKE